MSQYLERTTEDDFEAVLDILANGDMQKCSSPVDLKGCKKLEYREAFVPIGGGTITTEMIYY